jgi:ABC-2 type transport system permease protein
MSLFHTSGVKAVWRRQLGSLLGNPLCYIFILAYVLAAAVALFWPEDYYSRNITDLGTLLPRVMPWLFVVLLPALTMNAWSAEREQGTDELLLTLPISALDAVLGKYLAVVSYFTIALACSLTNIAALAWLGSPDLGQILATYVGWWFAGLALAGLGLLASVQVALPVIALILGALYCGGAVLGAQALDWFDPFNRGLVPLSGAVSALALAAAALAVALLQLGSRRWRPGSAPVITAQVLSLAFAVVVAVNLSRIAQRHYVDTDVSTEGLSSLSGASVQAIRQIENPPVTIAVFISQTLPAKLEAKAKEVLEKVSALERASGGKIEKKIYRPEDPSDDAGQLASHYGLHSFKAVEDTVHGANEGEEIFLSAAVVCAGRSQLIPTFDPGLSVEYELVRAARGVGRAKKPVLGLASTDLKMNGDFNMQTGQMAPAWSVVEEWKKQYEIREVDLGVEVAKDIDVLVAPEPSGLGEAQVQHLHDYIWNGRPALLLEDPLPISNPALAPSQPKKPANQFGQPPGEGAEKKADLRPLYHALGLDFDSNRIVWSKFNPIYRFRGQLPQTFVWVARDQGSIPDSPITNGMDLLVLPFPGSIGVAKDKAANLTVKPLLTASPHEPWGLQGYSDWVEQSFQGMRMRQPTGYVETPGAPPALAVEITGTMPSAYPRPAPGGDKKDDAKDAKKDDKPEAKPGVPSPAAVHVIVVADADFANNEFFDIYRSNAGEEEKFAELRNLRNVQFLANAVDALAGESAFLALRTRRPQSRPLLKLEKVVVETDSYVAAETARAEKKAKDALDKANLSFVESSNKVDSQENLDESSKQDRIEMLRAKAQRTLDATMRTINAEKDDTVRQAKNAQRREIKDERRWVRFLAIGFPTLVMFLLVITVSSVRLARERSHIPAARKRATV